ncbi:50S ribosomal protein L10 [Enterobacteriaceae endosymbiont of Donacia bicoloricornis]|uniref:50S ribosomal protein L10 n=1 Tax=Enterobacteriaceae endosymbiont of Donacia bicoloricornis TaxID=2675772 RepID=UPI001448E38B|nr:50S ribosomal protein L10 [Enterobacteriaceae endosymbiont of Donacia bicoloricornis]QJC37832.1 50S ribosomal protein L10 [Enterobacteriaceae endosymbiont of Donacia bicoloricornis]
MSLNITKKKIIVKKMIQINKNALSAVIVDFCGVNSNNLNKLRKKSRENDIIINIIRNKLLKLIIKDSNFQCLDPLIHGPILIAYSLKHPGAAARLLKKFSKIDQNFKIKAAAFENKIIDSKNINLLANLPTYKEAIINFLVIIKDISIGKFLRVLLAIKNIK